MDVEFEWDPEKAESNELKHGVSFEEARSVFYDDQAYEFYDDKNSEEEDRFLIVGMSLKFRVLMICHCERDDDVIRIISARKATKKEIEVYRGIR